MSKARLSSWFMVIMLLVLVTVLGGSVNVAAADVERGISLSTTYTSIIIAKNQNVTLPIAVANLGKVSEQVSIKISSAPQGWVADLVNENTSVFFEVRSLPLAVAETRLVFFRARPPAGITSGDYLFLVEAVSKDGLIKSSLGITIGIEEKPVVLSRVKLTTPYPDFRGPVDSNFEFKVSVTNDGSEDHTFTFSAEVPPRWEISFSPAFQPTKLIVALGVEAGKTEDLTVTIRPPLGAIAGTYSTIMKATSGDIAGSISLTTTLEEAGRELTHEFDMLPTSSRLDLAATAGQVSNLSILVSNRGSGELDDIRFFTDKPEGWLVTFSPETIASLLPGAAQELNVFITPTSKTIAGDYSLTLRGNATGVADSVNLRVRVGQSTIWGWIGLAIVLVVIAGMVTLFWRLGRR